MSRFIGRKRELDELDAIAAEKGAQFILVYGRRRVGKTTLTLHWAQDVQMNVVAVNWRERAILLGERKWGTDTVGRSVLRELLDKTPLVMRSLPEGGAGWAMHLALFARAGFTAAAQAEAQAYHAMLVDLARLDEGLVL